MGVEVDLAPGLPSGWNYPACPQLVGGLLELLLQPAHDFPFSHCTRVTPGGHQLKGNKILWSGQLASLRTSSPSRPCQIGLLAAGYSCLVGEVHDHVHIGVKPARSSCHDCFSSASDKYLCQICSVILTLPCSVLVLHRPPWPEHPSSCIFLASSLTASRAAPRVAGVPTCLTEPCIRHW